MAIQTYRGEEKLLTSDQFGAQLFDELEVLNPLVIDKGTHVPVTFISQLTQSEFEPPVGTGSRAVQKENVFLIPDTRLVDMSTWVAEHMLRGSAQVETFSLTYDYTDTVELATPSVQVDAKFILNPELFPVLAQASPDILERDISRRITRHKMDARPDVPRFLSSQSVDVNYWGAIRNLQVEDRSKYQSELAELNALLMSFMKRPDWYQLQHEDILLLQLASALAIDITK